jgi:hypothetical protein
MSIGGVELTCREGGEQVVQPTEVAYKRCPQRVGPQSVFAIVTRQLEADIIDTQVFRIPPQVSSPVPHQGLSTQRLCMEIATVLLAMCIDESRWKVADTK